MATAILKHGLHDGRGPGERLFWLPLSDRIKAARFHQRTWKELEENSVILEMQGGLNPSQACEGYIWKGLPAQAQILHVRAEDTEALGGEGTGPKANCLGHCQVFWPALCHCDTHS